MAHHKPAHHRKPGHQLRLLDAPLHASAALPVYTVRRCILCGATHVNTTTEGRTVTVHCQACEAIFEVEYDPPDSPTVRGRIEIISRRDGPLRAQ